MIYKRARTISKLAVFMFLISVILMPVITVNATELFGMDKLSQSRYLLQNDDKSYTFIDIDKHWAQSAMEGLTFMEILKGFPDGTLKPEKTISRAEFVTMLVRAVDIPITDYYSKYYDDIDASSWSYYHVSAAKKSGIIDIFNGTKFEPDKIITREEMAVIASKVVANIPVSGIKTNFKDIGIGYKYAVEVGVVSSLGIIKGLPDGSFNPKGNASRAEASVIIQRILEVRDANNETADAVLISTALSYEQKLIDDTNQLNTKLQTAIQMSTGKERKQNYLRAAVVQDIAANSLSITRTISKMSAQITRKSFYLAEIDVEYDLSIVNSSEILRDYNVKKKLFLLKKGNGWLVYNSNPIFSLIYANDQNEVSGKLNLVWQYMYNSTPDMSNTAKINGLNVISPTWFTLSSENGDIKSIAKKEYSDWAHNNGYKLWALVTNDFDRDMTSKMLNNAEARQKAVNTLLDYAEQYKLDGINVDFENMYTKDKDIFTQFVRELYEKSREKGLIISVDVTVIAPYSSWSACYDRAALAKVSDYIMLMAYDQHWGGSPISGSVAQLTWVEESLKKVLLEVPNNKLVLGLPFYTRLWKETYAAGSSTPTVTSKAISMEAAEQAVKDNNATKVWDQQSGQYYATYKKDGATYKIWLEDEKSIALKVQLVSKYNLVGVASWRLGFEKPEIWDAINENLN